MDSIEKIIIEKIQKSFPLSPDPYLDLSIQLNMDRDFIMKKIMELKEKGFIKKITPVMGNKYISSTTRALIGISVDHDMVDHFADILKGYNEITHIYEREGEYNVWFTFTTLRREGLDIFKNEFLSLKGIKKYIVLFSERMFKLDVKFWWDEHGDNR